MLKNTEETKVVKHGHWCFVGQDRYNAFGSCSICHTYGQLRTSRDEYGVWHINSPYCPACGSIMDGKINYI